MDDILQFSEEILSIGKRFAQDVQEHFGDIRDVRDNIEKAVQKVEKDARRTLNRSAKLLHRFLYSPEALTVSHIFFASCIVAMVGVILLNILVNNLALNYPRFLAGITKILLAVVIPAAFAGGLSFGMYIQHSSVDSYPRAIKKLEDIFISAKNTVTVYHTENVHLTEARRPLCLLVMMLYFFLSFRGFSHLQQIRAFGSTNFQSLFLDVCILLVIYSVETALATIYRITTMYRWRTRHFIEHHLPLVIIGSLVLYCCHSTEGRSLMHIQVFFSHVLFISFNEATAALLNIWRPENFQVFRNGLNLMVQISLLCIDLFSYIHVMRMQLISEPDLTMWFPLLLYQSILYAISVHMTYVKQVFRSLRKQKSISDILLAAAGALTFLKIVLCI